MVSNDDFDGKATHLNCFYTHILILNKNTPNRPQCSVHCEPETKLNSQYRANSNKWRGIIGTGFVALIIDKVWNMFS